MPKIKILGIRKDKIIPHKYRAILTLRVGEDISPLIHALVPRTKDRRWLADELTAEVLKYDYEPKVHLEFRFLDDKVELKSATTIKGSKN